MSYPQLALSATDIIASFRWLLANTLLLVFAPRQAPILLTSI
jgi:hypothetical protein